MVRFEKFKKLKSLGFTSINEIGTATLKIQTEYLDKNTGKFKLSNTRVSINDLNEIQKYCKTNSIKEIYNKKSALVSFVNKNYVYISISIDCDCVKIYKYFFQFFLKIIIIKKSCLDIYLPFLF